MQTSDSFANGLFYGIALGILMILVDYYFIPGGMY